MKFTRAIVRPPGKSIVSGLTTASLGQPDYELALHQHAAYVEALQACALDVMILEADETLPDSTFVEDTALLASRCAIVTRPGATSRRDEVRSIEPVLENIDLPLHHIAAPGSVEGGDIMMAGDHFFIGHSQRTNAEGAAQVAGFLRHYGYTATVVPLSRLLHLKSAVAYLEEDTVVIGGELLSSPAFAHYRRIEVPDDEIYACNCLWLNGTVLVAAGFPRTRQAIENHGFRTASLPMSEFQKVDGGLSCLSLRW